MGHQGASAARHLMLWGRRSPASPLRRLRSADLLRTNIARRVELTCSERLSGTVVPGAILPSGYRLLSSRHLPLP